MIVGQSTPDLFNKLKKYEAKIKELEATVKAQDELILRQGALIAGNEAEIGKLKCRIADLRLVVRRKGGTVGDEGKSPDDGLR